MLKKLFKKVGFWWVDFIILRVFYPVKHKKKVKTNTPGFVVYSDDSIAYKMNFIDRCDLEKKDWHVELESLYKKHGIRS